MAGLYEWWCDPALERDDPGAWLLSATIITTNAADAVGRIHDRMPVVVHADDWETWLDPAVGILGAIVIAHWSWRLIRDAGAVLLDAAPDAALVQKIRARLERGHDSISDLHVWRLGPGHHGAIVALVVDHPQPVETYKARLSDIPGLSHVTVEVHQCHGKH